MARIRSIKPEFPHSESMGKVSRDARLTFIEMWTISDDAGRLRGNSRMLASLLFPYDDDAPKKIDGWLSELEKQNCIVRYEVDGANYIQIQKWVEHQKIDKPSTSKIPQFDEASRMLSKPREDSLSLLGEEGKGKEGKGSKDQRSVREEKITLENLSVDHNAEWLARKRSEGRYTHHDEHFVLEQFKQYCNSKGKKYADYIDAYRNAFEWEKCQPKPNGHAGKPGGIGQSAWTTAAEQIIAEDRARAAERSRGLGAVHASP